MKLRKLLIQVISTIMFVLLLISCRTTKSQKPENNYSFPSFEEKERIDDGVNITVINKDDEVVFYYDGEKNTVTIPGWYWIKLINYGINTGGIQVED